MRAYKPKSDLCIIGGLVAGWWGIATRGLFWSGTGQMIRYIAQTPYHGHGWQSREYLGISAGGWKGLVTRLQPATASVMHTYSGVPSSDNSPALSVAPVHLLCFFIHVQM